jgi:hypothetical protein
MKTFFSAVEQLLRRVSAAAAYFIGEFMTGRRQLGSRQRQTTGFFTDRIMEIPGGGHPAQLQFTKSEKRSLFFLHSILYVLC